MRFEPHLDRLRDNERCSSWLIGKRAVNLLLVLIELFSLGIMAEALRAKIDRKSAISLKRGHFDPKFQIEGVTPPIIFARVVRSMNALQLVANSFRLLEGALKLWSFNPPSKRRSLVFIFVNSTMAKSVSQLFSEKSKGTVTRSKPFA